MRWRFAPNADRTANSCSRVAPRASKRIDTFPHPTASNNVTAPSSRYNVLPIRLMTHAVESFDLYFELLRELFGPLFGELLKQGLKGRVCASFSHTRLQADVDHQSRPRILGELERKVHVAHVPGEARRGHPDDGVVLMIQLQRPAQNSRIAEEMFLPKPVGQNDDWLRILSDRCVGRHNAAT